MPAQSSSVCFSSISPHRVVSSLEPHRVVTLRDPLDSAWWVKATGRINIVWCVESQVPYQLLPSYSTISSHIHTASSGPSFSVSGVCTQGVIVVERKVPRGQSCTVPRGAVHARERDSLEDDESDENIHTKTKEKPQTSSRSSKYAVVEKNNKVAKIKEDEVPKK